MQGAEKQKNKWRGWSLREELGRIGPFQSHRPVIHAVFSGSPTIEDAVRSHRGGEVARATHALVMNGTSIMASGSIEQVKGKTYNDRLLLEMDPRGARRLMTTQDEDMTRLAQ